MSPTDAPVSTPKTRMTVDEYWEFVNRPENQDRMFELHRGEVVELSRPKTPHGSVCANIGRILGNYSFAVERGFVTTNDAGVILEETPGTVVGPDVAYFAETLAFEDMEPTWSEQPPLIAVEVRSPNDKRKAVARKIEDYLANGVAVVCEVDYEERFVRLYRPDRTPHVVGDDAVLLFEELPGFSCPVADFFRTPGSKPAPAPPSA